MDSNLKNKLNAEKRLISYNHSTIRSISISKENLNLLLKEMTMEELANELEVDFILVCKIGKISLTYVSFFEDEEDIDIDGIKPQENKLGTSILCADNGDSKSYEKLRDNFRDIQYKQVIYSYDTLNLIYFDYDGAYQKCVYGKDFLGYIRLDENTEISPEKLEIYYMDYKDFV